MALYYDAASVLSGQPPSSGSLHSRIYDNTALKSPPGLVYRLIMECSKWDVILSEVLQNSGILLQEPKLTPLLSVLLVHDHLLSKRGIACPQNHALRLAIERHKARLQSEFTKSRLRRKCSDIDALREYIGHGLESRRGQIQWVRINRLKVAAEEELAQNFSDVQEASTSEALHSCDAAEQKLFCRDKNIPDLLATNLPLKVLTQSKSYRSGRIILQDKASCFPAHLLLNSSPQTEADCGRELPLGDVLDACAAPGNKTSHVASILASKSCSNLISLADCQRKKRTIFACERDARRSHTLQAMLERAGALVVSNGPKSDDGNNGTETAAQDRNILLTDVLAQQDFLNLDPRDAKFARVTHILLDPSCSGSGIPNRKDMPNLTLPEDPRKNAANSLQVELQNATNKKRKRQPADNRPAESTPTATSSPTLTSAFPKDTHRLYNLSHVQRSLLIHAFSFPSACLVTYSTCSIHFIENEDVAWQALQSDVARRRGWRVLRRSEQVEGLRVWKSRGRMDEVATEGEARVAGLHDDGSHMKEPYRDVFLDACIRCYPSGFSSSAGAIHSAESRKPEEAAAAAASLKEAATAPATAISEMNSGKNRAESVDENSTVPTPTGAINDNGGTIGFFLVGFVRDDSDENTIAGQARIRKNKPRDDDPVVHGQHEVGETADQDDDTGEWQGFASEEEG